MVGIYVVGDPSKGAEEGVELSGTSVVVGCASKKEVVSVGEFGGVAIGEGGNLVVFGEGGMFACGPNGAKQLGVGKQAPILARWVSVQLGRVVRSVAPGSHHSLLCSSDGGVFSCGRGDGGQLGLGDKTKHVTNFQQIILPPGVIAKQVSVASSARRFENQSASYILTTAGACLSFGNNNHQKLGLGAGVTTNAWAPAPVAHEGVAFDKISAGKHHVLACDAAGFVYSWGSGDMGRLGLSDKKHRGIPTKVELGIPLIDGDKQSPAVKIDAVVARETFSIALSTASGAVFTWGFGTRGQLGRGQAGTRGEPAQPGRVDLGAAKIARLAANDDACVAFVQDSLAGHYVWGQLELGDLKIGSQEPIASLALSTPLENILGFDLAPSYAIVALQNDIPDKRTALEPPIDEQPPEKLQKLDASAVVTDLNPAPADRPAPPAATV
ncbi:hypothetical protein CTAYLR_008487 [Chrysophaeum taylorii]|uniref:Regulator of chromosome condensation n=1 Tax=Chrysophaeum taylorii TaxID=2483200 RepID=A0AAD7XJZ3_9STRA|nr:hypothetical protein CTAYLR_008487 [Chrysophaeum taylorii]